MFDIECSSSALEGLKIARSESLEGKVYPAFLIM